MTAALPSWLARLGVGVLVALSIAIGFQYWQSRGDDQLAWITVAAEIIAFAGLAVARAQWKINRGWAIIAIALTLLAAAWCGLTMFEKIRDDSRARAVAEAEMTLAYTTARADLAAASSALRAALTEPRPENQGPLTIAAWDRAQAARVARLEQARDSALARMEAALPQASFDWIAVVRGVGVEVIKLLGFAAFGLSMSPLTEAPAKPRRRWWRLWRLPVALGATAVATTPAFAGQAIENTSVSAIAAPDPIVRLPETSKKAQAFALRGRMRPEEIAATIGAHRATVYRWFRARDLQTQAGRAA